MLSDAQFIVVLMFVHYVADFLLQTSWMANNKSKSLLPLTTHILVYSLTVGVGFAWILSARLSDTLTIAELTNRVVEFTVINGSLHFGIDYVTSRCSSKLFAAGRIGDAFKVIGFDQFLHALCLILTYDAFTTYNWSCTGC